MEFSYRVIPWILLLFISACAEELLVYDFDLDSNHTEESTSKYNTTSVTCVRDHLYDHFDIREVLGKWKVRTLYMHLTNEGVSEYHSCPVVTIWEEDHFPSTTFGVGLLLSITPI